MGATDADSSNEKMLSMIARLSPFMGQPNARGPTRNERRAAVTGLKLLNRIYGVQSTPPPTEPDIAVQVRAVNGRVMYVAHLHPQDSGSLIANVLRGNAANADFRRAQKAMTKDDFVDIVQTLRKCKKILFSFSVYQ